MDSDEDVLYDEVGSGSENEIDYGGDSESSNMGAKKNEPEDYPFEVLSPDEIVKHMIDFIREVNSVLEMPETITRILLNHFKWDKQKLLDRFYDGNQDKLFQEAHIVNPFKKEYQEPKKPGMKFFWQKSQPQQQQQQQPPSSPSPSSNALEDCEVCYSSLPLSKLAGLQCGHRFCTDCWNDYLRVKIMDEGIVQTIACIAHKCGILVDDTTVMSLVKDPKVKQKYQQLITNSFVDCNKLMRWCLTPGCNRAIKVQYVEAKPVTCACHLTFCFECGEKWHEPINCELLRKWEKKCKDDSETSNWIVAHTKDCPSCHSSIEKNGGCNHMTCRKCGKSFCWLCLSPMGGYNHGCNIYAEDKAVGPRDKSRAALERYLFYSNRYMNHLASFRFESELHTNVQYKMEDMDEHNMTWAEVQFLKCAVDTLVSCRQTLMYTYAFAFYLRKNNQTVIFEANQQDLEHATEILSGYLERDIAVENLADIKQQVLDKYIYCENRRQALLKHVREGQEKDWWEFVGA